MANGEWCMEMGVWMWVGIETEMVQQTDGTIVAKNFNLFAVRGIPPYAGV